MKPNETMEEAGIIRSENIRNNTDVQYDSMQNWKNWFIILNSLLVVGLFAVSTRFLHNDSLGRAVGDTISAVCLFTLAFASTEIMLRIYHFFIDLTQLNTKYKGDIAKVLITWNLNTPSWITIASSFTLFMILHNIFGNTIYHVWSFGPKKCLPAFFISIILCRMISLKNSILINTLGINSMDDYGTGMAYSYYYGYLQLVLPTDGSRNRGIRHKMEEYEATQNVSILVKKLFILIPESGHIPPDLNEASDYWLESTTSLESEVRDRAGVKRRVYKNTVYKIHPGGDMKTNRPVYITTEGATPMLTLWEILKHSHPQTAIYRARRHEIIASFYRTLQTLLINDPRCRDLCELVYYRDYNADGKKVNVGEILLRRILTEISSSTLKSYELT